MSFYDEIREEAFMVDLEAARRDEGSYLCDRCRRNSGSMWFGDFWLCARCMARAVKRLSEEAYGEE